MIHVTKSGLYKQVNYLRNSLGLEPDEYGIDTVKLCKDIGIRVENAPFCSPGLRGMAIVGNEGESDVIFLNSARTPREQNVDCGHECMHLGIHRNEPCRTFKCFEKVAPGQDKYVEWQANEGSAELIVPYRNLLRQVKRYEHLLCNHANIAAFKAELKEVYNVTDAVITIRLESLKYEIAQYLAGVPMDELRILSNTSQIKEGIRIKSLNAIANGSYYINDLNMDIQLEQKRTALV